MKMQRHADYREGDTARCEQALLTVWAYLHDFAEHLVLIGGLVPRYLGRSCDGELSAQTMDVDLGISLAADGGHYDPISTRLRMHDFYPEPKTGRFVRAMASGDLIIDFLADKASEDAPDATMVDDVSAQTVLGLDRALATACLVNISGTDIHGAKVSEQVRVCDVGPFLCLKLSAYAGRAEPKDVFDSVRCAMDYTGGYEAAIAAFQAESSCNKAFPKAKTVLEGRFGTSESKGPVDYANFCLSGRQSDARSMDYERLLQARRNEAWLLGRSLLASIR